MIIARTARPSAGCRALAALLSVALLVLAGGCSDGGGSSPPPPTPGVSAPESVEVALGSTVAFGIAVTDPNDIAKAWRVRPVSPFPMLPTATFEVERGLVRYRPQTSEVGERAFVFSAAPEDGSLPPIAVSVRVIVTARPATDPTELSGTVRDAATEGPIAGATIRVGGVEVQTDDAGQFRLGNVPTTSGIVDVDGSTAGGGDPWSTAAVGLEQVLGHAVYAGQNNVIDRAIYLARLGPVAGTIDAGVVSTIRAANGVQIVVPPGGARTSAGVYAGPVHLPELEAEFLPVPLPSRLQPAFVVGVQPVDLAFDPPAAITLPNTEGFESGTRLDLFGADPVRGWFTVVGELVVSNDGERLETAAGGLRAAGYCFALPPAAGRTAVNPDQNGEHRDPASACKARGTGISVQTGNLQVVHALRGYRSLGAERRLQLVYNSNAVDPRPLIHATAFVPDSAELPATWLATLSFGGVLEPGRAFVQPSRVPVRLARRPDANGLQTGCYPYRLEITSLYPESRRTRRLQGDALVVNEVDSAFGSGWSLNGLARVRSVPGHSRIVLTEGDGGIKAFRPQLVGEQPIATEICLVLDGSSSMNNLVVGTGQTRWQLQREGLAQAIEDPDLPRDGSYTFSVVQCASTFGSPAARVEIVPTAIDSEAAALALANAIRALDIQTGFSPLADAVALATDQLSPQRDHRQLIWVVCDGDPEDDNLAASAADRAVSRGVDTIDVVAVSAAAEVARLQRIVRGGSLAYAAGFVEFAATAKTKLMRLVRGVPAGEFSRVVANPDGSFTRTFLSGRVQEFDVEGLLRADVDHNGNRTEFDYDASQQLVSLRGPAGRETRFGYAESGLVQSITHPGGGVTTLAHDGTDLVAITDPDDSLLGFSYDASHRLVGEVDARGFERTYEYDVASGRAIRMVDALGNSVEVVASQTLAVLDASTGTKASPAVALAEADAVSRVTSRRGHETTIRTDRFGRIVRRQDPLGHVVQYDRDANGLVTSFLSPRGRTDQYRYDANGNRLVAIEAVGVIGTERTTSWQFAADSDRVLRKTDGESETTGFEYDASGNLLRIVYPDQSERQFGYDGRGLVASFVDENDHETTMTYDGDGLLETVTDPLSHVIRHTYDARGNVTSVVEGQGTSEQRTRQFTYDAANRLLTASDGAGGVTTFTYDEAGSLLTTTMPTGEAEERSYDALGRLASLEDPRRGSLAFTYDADGNLLQRTDARGNATGYEHDAANRRTAVIDAALGATGFGYDPSGNVVSQTDARQNTTTFAYDLLERRIGLTTPIQRTFSWAYDALDRVTRESQPGVGAIVHVYDPRGRRTTTTVPAGNGVGGNLIGFTYDAVGNLLTVSDDDTEVEFVYDECNRVLEERTLVGGVQPVVTVTSSYDAVGNRSAMVDSVGGMHAYEHDGAGRMMSVETAQIGEVSWTRDASGRRRVLTFPNGMTGMRDYFANGRPAEIVYTRSTGVELLSLAYQWGASGLLEAIEDGGMGQTFAYDSLERLTGDSALAPMDYAYDAASNRTRSNLTSSATFNADNQLTGDDTGGFGYDPRGNLGVFDPLGTPPPQQYRWNAQNQLVEATGISSYRYDGLGRRVEKVVGGVVRRFVYDGDNVLLEFDDVGQLVARYTHGDPGEGPIAVSRSGTSFYYLTDHDGSVRALSSPGGAAVNRYRYDRFGRMVEQFEAIENPFTFLGGIQLDELDWYWIGGRWYSPDIGRFCSEASAQPVGLTDDAGWQSVRPGSSRYAFLPGSVGGCGVGGRLGRGDRCSVPSALLEHHQGKATKHRAAGHARGDQPHESGR